MANYNSTRTVMANYNSIRTVMANYTVIMNRNGKL
jgi:hypothetical protein